jgi:hypothetical protein
MPRLGPKPWLSCAVDKIHENQSARGVGEWGNLWRTFARGPASPPLRDFFYSAGCFWALASRYFQSAHSQA